MYVYLRSRIYFHNLVSSVSHFYTIPKGPKDYLKISTTHYFAKGGNSVVVK